MKTKLYDISVDFGYAVGDLGDAPEAKQAIKDLIDEVVGVQGLSDGKTGPQLWKEISERARKLL